MSYAFYRVINLYIIIYLVCCSFLRQTSRYRSSDSKKDLQNHILSSLDYFDKLNENGCEYRVFCELLVSASSMKDSERHVENLLDNFAKQ